MKLSALTLLLALLAAVPGFAAREKAPPDPMAPGLSGPPRLAALLEYFTVRLKLPEKKGDLYRMELVPKYQRIAKRLKSMTLWIDGETFFPSRLKYEEPDGDTVEYQFSDFKRNAPIPDDRFVVKL